MNVGQRANRAVVRRSVTWTTWLIVPGELSGATAYVYELVQPRHPSTPTAPVASRSHGSPLTRRANAEALESLDLLVSQNLLQCYLQHVHFFLPVLDASTLTQCKEEDLRHGLLGGSPLLYWAVMLAAANVPVYCVRGVPLLTYSTYKATA